MEGVAAASTHPGDWRRAFCRPAWAHSAHQSACPYDPWNMACGFNARFSPKLCCALLVHFPLKG
eukprot:scaffold81784_cov19-Tisochrysis_lutea.AAC.1